jgi:hypothetical protein
VVGERGVKSKTWPDSSRALSGRLRRAATFLRKIGIEISFGREGRARTRTISIITDSAPETEGIRPSTPSASSAPTQKASPANGFVPGALRTVGGNADGSDRDGDQTVRAKPLKTNAGNAADGADANRPPQSAPLKQARAAGIRLGIDGDDLALEASAPPRAAHKHAGSTRRDPVGRRPRLISHRVDLQISLGKKFLQLRVLALQGLELLPICDF